MIHEAGCECGSYACTLRAKNITVRPGRERGRPYKGKPGSNAEYNQMNRGIAGEHRAGGTFMPYLEPNAQGVLDRVPIKRHRELRHVHNEIRRRQHDEAVSAGHHH